MWLSWRRRNSPCTRKPLVHTNSPPQGHDCPQFNVLICILKGETQTRFLFIRKCRSRLEKFGNFRKELCVLLQHYSMILTLGIHELDRCLLGVNDQEGPDV